MEQKENDTLNGFFFKIQLTAARLWSTGGAIADMPPKYRKRPDITMLAGYLFANPKDRFSCGVALLFLCVTFEPRHEISNNMVCASSKSSDQSLCLWLKYYMTVKLLTDHQLEFLSLKGDCTGSSEYIHVNMPHQIYRFVSCSIAVIQRSGGEQELTCRK